MDSPAILKISSPGVPRRLDVLVDCMFRRWLLVLIFSPVFFASLLSPMCESVISLPPWKTSEQQFREIRNN